MKFILFLFGFSMEKYFLKCCGSLANEWEYYNIMKNTQQWYKYPWLNSLVQRTYNIQILKKLVYETTSTWLITDNFGVEKSESFLIVPMSVSL